jgi:hypothetical protein
MTVMSLSDPGLLAAQKCKRLWAKLGNLCASEPSMRNGNVALGTLEHSQWQDAERAVGYDWSVAFKKMVTTIPTTAAGAAEMINCFLESENDMLSEPTIALLENLRRFLQGCESELAGGVQCSARNAGIREAEGAR